MSKLKKCSDCEHEISKKAKMCPNCGAKNNGNLKKILGIFVIGYLFFTIFSSVMDGIKQQEIKEAQAVVVEENKKSIIAEFQKSPDEYLGDVQKDIDSSDFKSADNKLRPLYGLNDERVIKINDTLKNAFEAERVEITKNFPDSNSQNNTHVDSWSVNRSSSKMDDSASFSASKDSKNNFVVWPRKRIFPHIQARCRENTTDFIFISGTSFAVEDEYDHAFIRYRIDSDKAVGQYWSESTDDEAAFAQNPIALLKRLTNAETLYVEFTPFNSNPVVAEFDVRGIKPHIEEIAKTCNWSL